MMEEMELLKQNLVRWKARLDKTEAYAQELREKIHTAQIQVLKDAKLLSAVPWFIVEADVGVKLAPTETPTALRLALNQHFSWGWFNDSIELHDVGQTEIIATLWSNDNEIELTIQGDAAAFITDWQLRIVGTELMAQVEQAEKHAAKLRRKAEMLNALIVAAK